MGGAWIRTRTQMRTCACVCACRHTRASTSGGSSCDVSPILESLANFSTIFSLALSISSCGGGCVCVCVCVCVYEIHKFKRATLQRTHAHVQHALHTQVRVQHCITAGSSPSSSSGACVSSTSFKFLRSTHVSVTHTPTHMGCVRVRTMTRLFMHADMPEYMEHDPVAPTRFWYLRIRLCSRRGKRPLSRSKSLP